MPALVMKLVMVVSAVRLPMGFINTSNVFWSLRPNSLLRAYETPYSVDLVKAMSVMIARMET